MIQKANCRPPRQPPSRIPATSRSPFSERVCAVRRPAGSIPPRQCHPFHHNGSSRHHKLDSQIVPPTPFETILGHSKVHRFSCRSIPRRRTIRRPSNPPFQMSPPKPPPSQFAADGTDAQCFAYATTIQLEEYVHTDSNESVAKASSIPSKNPSSDNPSLSSDPSNHCRRMCQPHSI